MGAIKKTSRIFTIPVLGGPLFLRQSNYITHSIHLESMKHAGYFLFFALFFFASASAQKGGNYESLQSKAGWLIGQWGFTMPEGTLSETWTVLNDSTYAGHTYFVIGKDTVFSEDITLEQRGNGIHYVTVIKDQNEGKPVAFSLTSAGKKQLVFENKAHDYPQKITYTKTAKGLVAEISGMQNGKAASEKFPMDKLK